MPEEQNLIWIDLEMTGLNPTSEKIIEIAVVVTSKNLDIVAKGPDLIIKQDDELLESMDDWNKKTHGASGLIDKVRKSKISTEEAEEQVLTFLRKYVPAGKSPLCGNSVHQDRRFMHLYMPKLEQYFHYRHLDVSTVKILSNLWAPNIAPKIKKSSTHRAMEDILDSIDELKYYKKNVFREFP